MLDHIIEYLAPIAAALIAIAVIADFFPWHDSDGYWRWAGRTMTKRKVVNLRLKRPTRVASGVVDTPRTQAWRTYSRNA
jgi:hypothetical protein